jgi:hypothetical protein
MVSYITSWINPAPQKKEKQNPFFESRLKKIDLSQTEKRCLKSSRLLSVAGIIAGLAGVIANFTNLPLAKELCTVGCLSALYNIGDTISYYWNSTGERKIDFIKNHSLNRAKNKEVVLVLEGELFASQPQRNFPDRIPDYTTIEKEGISIVYNNVASFKDIDDTISKTIDAGKKIIGIWINSFCDKKELYLDANTTINMWNFHPLKESCDRIASLEFIFFESAPSYLGSRLYDSFEQSKSHKKTPWIIPLYIKPCEDYRPYKLVKVRPFTVKQYDYPASIF